MMGWDPISKLPKSSNMRYIDIANAEDSRGAGQVLLRDQVAYHRAVEYLHIALENLKS
eukprot:gene9553-12898_t